MIDIGDEYPTPQNVFDEYHRAFSFDYDACSSHENAKCRTYSTKEGTFLKKPYYFKAGKQYSHYEYTVSDCGLKINWGGFRVWCNPPYSKGLKDAFIEKAIQEIEDPNGADIIVMLLPVKTDTKSHHRLVNHPMVSVRYLQGRISFNGAGSGRFASMVAIFWRSVER